MTENQKLKHAAVELALKMPGYAQYQVQTMGMLAQQPLYRSAQTIVADAKVFYEYLKSTNR